MTSDINAAAWKTEVERVMPQLKVTIKSDNKDWRAHVEQMTSYQNSIGDLLTNTQKHLDKLHQDISKTLEKVESREKYVNTQLDNIVSEFRQKQDKLAATNESYKESSSTVVELTRKLATLTDELDNIKAQMDERGNRMTDSQPLVKIKQVGRAALGLILEPPLTHPLVPTADASLVPTASASIPHRSRRCSRRSPG